MIRRALAVAGLVVLTACSNSRLPDSVQADGRLGSAAGGIDDAGIDGQGSTGGDAGGPGAAGGGPAATGAGGAGSATSSGATGSTGGTGGSGSSGNGSNGGSTTSSAASIGVTRTSITISVSAPFSGPFGPVVDKLYTNGVETWMKDVNANGGIHGRRIVLKKLDNQNSADGAVAACKEAKSNGTFMVINILGNTSETDCEDAAGIPVFDSQPTYLRPWKRSFALLHPPMFAEAAVSFLKSGYLNAGNRIGVVYVGDQPQNVAEYEAVAAELRRQGLQLVHTEKVAGNQASFISEMQRMQNADPDVVMLYVNFEAAGIIRDANAIRFETRWFSGPKGAANDISSRAGNEQFRGVRAVRAQTTADTPAFRAYVEKVRTHQGESRARNADTADALGYSVGDIAGHILRMTGPNLTRDTFAATARTIENYENGLMGPYTLKGRADLVGLRAVFPIECCAGDYTYKALGPPRERF